jgi:O-antigen ligase
MKNKLLYNSAFIYGLVFPLSTKLGNIALAIFMAILLFFFKNKPKNGITIIWFSTIYLFALLLLGLFFSDNISDTINLFGRYATYLLIPFLLLFLDKDQLVYLKKRSLLGLIVGVTIASLVLLTNNFIKYYSIRPLFTIDKDLFNYYHTYHCFTEILKIYPTYFGLYAILSLIGSLEFILTNMLKRDKILIGLTIPIQLMTILFLNARIITIIVLMLVVYYSFVLLKKVYFRSKFFFLISIIGMFLLSILLFSSVRKTYMYSRFSQELVWDLTPNINTSYNGKYKADSRIARWESAFSAIKERPTFGYGSAMEKEVLHERFQENGLNFAATNYYDSHNQYLSITIEFGLIGLSLFLFYLFSNFYFSFQNKDKVSLFFFTSLILVGLFENLFKNNAGIIFVAFFSNVFLFSNQKK